MTLLDNQTYTKRFEHEVGISREIIQAAQAKSELYGPKCCSRQIAKRYEGINLKRINARNQILMEILQNQHACMPNFSFFEYLLFITDTHGLTLWINGSNNLLPMIETRRNIGIGASFAISSAGTNAVALCTELQRAVYVQGNDHYLEFMKGWNSLAMPIRNFNKNIVGTVGILTEHHVPGTYILPCIEMIASSLENEFKKYESIGTARGLEELVQERLDQYKLTPREIEIANYWILDYDCKQISKLIGISENTVRVYINKINSKVKVNSKASLILRAFGAI